MFSASAWGATPDQSSPQSDLKSKMSKRERMMRERELMQSTMSPANPQSAQASQAQASLSPSRSLSPDTAWRGRALSPERLAQCTRWANESDSSASARDILDAQKLARYTEWAQDSPEKARPSPRSHQVSPVKNANLWGYVPSLSNMRKTEFVKLFTLIDTGHTGELSFTEFRLVTLNF